MRSLKYLESDEVVIEKWGYATFAGVIGLAMGYDSGWFSPYLGFAVGFFSVFLGLIWLELRVQEIRLKRQLKQDAKAASDKTAVSPPVQAGSGQLG